MVFPGSRCLYSREGLAVPSNGIRLIDHGWLFVVSVLQSLQLKMECLRPIGDPDMPVLNGPL